ncbi:MAG: arginine--tRNA ligase [Lachnospiraceae bacterium]|nr:arginine--tRNA ligase [Lachnospiraceae bacterium]
MQNLTDLLTKEVGAAFEAAGFDRELGKVGLSNRPDLCEFQCNGAMAGAKKLHKNPFDIAEAVVKELADSKYFSSVEAVRPGFLNMKLNPSYLREYLTAMDADERLGLETSGNKRKIVIDYGGPNVAKPLHIGHLRSAIIGESVKRLARLMGHDVTSDVHLGDWGLQMGLIITELKERKPDLPYFDESFEGDYPEEAPFTLSELEEIYPTASGKSKEDEDFKNAAMDATFKLQHGDRGYRALWKHIINISVADLKKNYSNLNVDFDLWKGESDADPYIPDMVEKMKKDGFAYESQGALVVDVAEESDTKEVPPCMILKSDGAALYTTTDLATLVEREKDFKPDQVIYVVDKRQSLHFVQVFRCSKKTGIVPEDTKLDFLGFGTMNGKDGKPFKTRAGGVMRLENLIADVNEEMLKKMTDSDSIELSEEEAKETAKIVALSAIKYGDLSNQASKDYVFDIDKFTSFEGNTGPYIMYTMVRIKSILRKYAENGGKSEGLSINEPVSEEERALMLTEAQYSAVMSGAFEELAPHRICAYIYELANNFNRFYHGTKILSETDDKKKEGWIALLKFSLKILESCIDVLGMEAPERM